MATGIVAPSSSVPDSTSSALAPIENWAYGDMAINTASRIARFFLVSLSLGIPLEE